MSNSTQTNWRKEYTQMQKEVEKLKLLVDEISGLKLVKKRDGEFSLIDDAMYCAQKLYTKINTFISKRN